MTAGARPRLTSSSSSTSGFDMSARAIAVAWRSPPLRSAAERLRRSATSGSSSYTLWRVHWPFRFVEAPTSRFSSTVSEPNRRRPSGTRMMPSRACWWAGNFVMSRPRCRMRPPVGDICPASVFKSVDLPAPFAPMPARVSPSSSFSEMPRRAGSWPYAAESSSTSSTMGLPSEAGGAGCGAAAGEAVGFCSLMRRPPPQGRCRGRRPSRGGRRAPRRPCPRRGSRRR